MQYKKTFFVLAVSFIPFLYAQEDSESTAKQREQVTYQAPQAGENISDVKTKFIQKLVLSFVNFKDDISDPSIVQEIEEKIREVIPLVCGLPADLRTESDVRKEVEAIVLKKYPVTDADYRAKVAGEADRKFRVYKHGENVQIRYRSGRNICVVRGRFGQFNGRSVNINYKHVPFYDIVEEDKAHVSEEYSKLVRKKYIEDACTRYQKQKNELRSIQTARIRKEIEDGNLAKGYIFHIRKWYTAREMMQSIIAEQIKLHPEIVRSKDVDKDGAVRVDTKKINRKSIRDKVSRIKGLLIGKDKVDVDSGCFDAVYWGFSRAEVKVSLEGIGLKMSTVKDHDIVYTTDRQLKNVKLTYKNSRLVKVEEIYNINDIDAIVSLKAALKKKYDADDLQKQGKSSGTMDSVSWTGKITKGTLKIVIRDEETIEDVRLIREPIQKENLDWFGKGKKAEAKKEDAKKEEPAAKTEKTEKKEEPAVKTEKTEKKEEPAAKTEKTEKKEEPAAKTEKTEKTDTGKK